MAFFGLTDPDAIRVARSYAAYAARAGLSRKQIAEHISWFVRNHPDGKEIQLEPLVHAFDRQFGRDVAVKTAEWFDTADEHGVEAIELDDPPSDERAAEIRELMKTDPQSYYSDPWHAQDLQDYIEAQENSPTGDVGQSAPDSGADNGGDENGL